MLSVLPLSNADTSSCAAGKRSRMEASAGWVLILEAAAARKGRVLEEGFGCGAESAWCSLCVRSCFCGACSMGAGSEAEQRAG